MEKYTLPVVIEKDEYGYFAMCPALQGCYSQGGTYGETLENIKDAICLQYDQVTSYGYLGFLVVPPGRIEHKSKE